MSERFVICDIEATGLEAHREMIEIALITFEAGKVTDVYSTLLNPLVPVSAEVQHLTLISPRDLEAAPKFYDVAEAIRNRIEGKIFVSHNTDFDLGLLQRKFTELGDPLVVKSFCTLKGAQDLIPGMTSYSLEALGSFFRIRHKDAHRALPDAEATLELFKELQNLRYRYTPEDLFHPRHEKLLKSLPAKAGILILRDEKGKTLLNEATEDLLGRARQLLRVRPENRWLIEETTGIDSRETGTALIAELEARPHRKRGSLLWKIVVQERKGEKSFALRPLKGRERGHWFFSEKKEALKKLRKLEAALRDSRYLYREGPRTKDEIIETNLKVDGLLKEAQFPSDDLLILGDGRRLGERSLVLIREGRVRGYGFTEASEEEINARPDAFVSPLQHPSLAKDLSAIRYLRELKHKRKKREAWRSIPKAQ